MTLDIGSLVGEKYRLEERLGKGGMGEVWSARHLELGAGVAVKFGEAGGRDPLNQDRFRREAQMLAQLRSPYSVHVYDFGFHRGRPFIVMELLRGRTLQTELDGGRTLSLKETCVVASQIAKGLAVLHAADLVHRDVKPSNIFLARSGDQVTAKLLDFGIVESGHPPADHIRSDSIVGSPRFMSPEQAQGLPIDYRSDLWSLAAVLFRTITGSNAFRGKSLPQLFAQICAANARVATKSNPGLPRGIDRFFAKAFAANPGSRFQCAEELAREFCRAAGVPTPAILGWSDTADQDDFARSSDTVRCAASAMKPLRSRSLLAAKHGIGAVVLTVSIGLTLGFGWRASSRPARAAASSGVESSEPGPAVAAPSASGQWIRAGAVPSTPPSVGSEAPASPPSARATRLRQVRALAGKPRPAPAPSVAVDPLFGLVVPATKKP